MSSRLCPWCMQMTDADTCPHCGKSTDYTCLPVHLPAGYVVHGKHPYVLGAALGQGGFGITYIALDMQTNERVAIKEYFPTFCANRTDGAVWSYPNQEDVFLRGRDRFLDEARVLKSLSDLSSIVNVLDFFERNNSAYLVMEFLEGDSLKAYAKKHGRFPAQAFLQQLKPLMEDIERMHQRGVVHRDIAPDNIILTPEGQLKLIDFGAARSYVGDKSMTVVVKKGFAPIEQYMRHGSTAATDVYALAATIYYCITGTVPPDSAERQYDEDMLKSPISLGAELSREQERAILNALEVQPKKRTQSVAELIKALEHAPRPEKQKPVKAVEKPQPIKEEEKPKPVKKAEKSEEEPKKKVKWIIPAIAAALLCIVGTVLFMGKETPIAPVETAPQQMEVPETTVPETEPPVFLSEEAQKYNEAVDFFNNGEYGKAAIAFAKLGDYRDAREVSLKIWDAIAERPTLATDQFFTAAVKEDATVVSCGSNAPKVSKWENIISIVPGMGDGEATTNQMISWGSVFGLRSDGTVLRSERHKSEQITKEGWTDIVSIVMAKPYLLGLKPDGTVVCYKEQKGYQIIDEELYLGKVSALRDVVRIAVDDWETRYWQGDEHPFPTLYVWTADGKVYKNFEPCKDQNFVDVRRGYIGTAILQKDGTVTFEMNSEVNKYSRKAAEKAAAELPTWTDIVSISGPGWDNYFVGLKADGTVVGTGYKTKQAKWKDVVLVDAVCNYFGLKSDGTLVSCGANMTKAPRRGSENWKNIRLPADRDALLAAIDLDYITEE